MLHVTELFPMETLQAEIDAGFVRMGTHPQGNLRILGYTEKAQFEKRWNPVTLNCRGLIVDDDGFIVARPWKKFFNYGEGRLKIDDSMPVEVTDKMDGSLGILYPIHLSVDYVGCIATRGSFVSDQAIHATKLWSAKYERHINFQAMFTYTFLFEIIYPANRIVLDYEGLDDLVLLGAVNIDRGYYIGPTYAASLLEWPGPVTQTFEYNNMAEAFAAPMRPNAEGLVVRSGTEMVKIKQVDYVELHRIVTNLNARSVWLHLGEGKTVSDLCEQIPDEFHGFVKETADNLSKMYYAIEDAVLEEFHEHMMALPEEFTRREFAEKVAKSPNRAYLFSLLDEKSISGSIWQSIRPSASKE